MQLARATAAKSPRRASRARNTGRPGSNGPIRAPRREAARRGGPRRHAAPRLNQAHRHQQRPQDRPGHILHPPRQGSLRTDRPRSRPRRRPRHQKRPGLSRAARRPPPRTPSPGISRSHRNHPGQVCPARRLRRPPGRGTHRRPGKNPRPAGNLLPALPGIRHRTRRQKTPRRHHRHGSLGLRERSLLHGPAHAPRHAPALNRPGAAAEQIRKQFFFEKKNQKTFTQVRAGRFGCVS